MECSRVASGRCMLLVLAVLNCVCIGVMCGNSTYKTALNAALLEGYNPSVHPGKHYFTQLLNINVSFALTKIQTFDELTSVFAITGVLIASWYDERLKWTPKNYNNLTSTHIKQKDIWTPPFVLSNSNDNIDLIGNGEIHVGVTFTGSVNWLLSVKLSSSCDADVTYYPIDEHVCSLLLMPWGYPAGHLQLSVISATLDLKEYTENPIWNLANTFQYSFRPPNVGFGMKITFKRKPLFAMVNFILPTIFVCFINMMVFILPAESGERVGFSITVLLAVAVFLSSMTSILPETSTLQVALLCYLLVSQIVQSLMIMECTILGLRFYLRSEEERVPRWIARLTRLVGEHADRNNSSVDLEPQNQVFVITKTDQDGIEIDEGKHVVLSDNAVSWKHVGKTFDKVCCVFFLMTAISCNTAFLVVMSN